MTDEKKPEAPKPPPFDQRLANEAAAAEQCMKLGAVILNSSRGVGFQT